MKRQGEIIRKIQEMTHKVSLLNIQVKQANDKMREVYLPQQKINEVERYLF